MSYVSTQPYRQFAGWRPPSPRRASGAGEYRRCRRGMGQSASQIVGTVGGAASGIVTAAAAPATAAALGIGASLAVPIVGAVFAGILFGVEELMNTGCGQACVVTSQWANQAEALLKQNLEKYLSLSPRTTSDKQSALNMFDAIWAGLVQRCSQSGLSTAGRNCIADRQAGACKWRDSTGACFNWFSGYRDPIANDTDVVDDSAVAQLSSAVSSVLPGVSSSFLLPLALIAALVVVGVML
jgi:hypothetical protein